MQARKNGDGKSGQRSINEKNKSIEQAKIKRGQSRESKKPNSSPPTKSKELFQNPNLKPSETKIKRSKKRNKNKKILELTPQRPKEAKNKTGLKNREIENLKSALNALEQKSLAPASPARYPQKSALQSDCHSSPPCPWSQKPPHR